MVRTDNAASVDTAVRQRRFTMWAAVCCGTGPTGFVAPEHERPPEHGDRHRLTTEIPAVRNDVPLAKQTFADVTGKHESQGNNG